MNNKTAIQEMRHAAPKAVGVAEHNNGTQSRGLHKIDQADDRFDDSNVEPFIYLDEEDPFKEFDPLADGVE